MKSKLNVVIVNFKTPELTLKCVESVIRQGVAAADSIIVVENDSPDDSYAKLCGLCAQGVQVIRARSNGGFSAGVNIGLEHTTSEYMLVLNPDTYFLNNSITHVLAWMDTHPGVGIVGLDLTYPDGSRQYGARRFYSWFDILARRTALGKFWPMTKRVESHLMQRAWDVGPPFEADWVMGTGFIIRADLLRSLGGMDPSYFLYMEDVDLCARVWGAGYQVFAFPNAKLIHDYQRQSAAGPLSWGGQQHFKSLGVFRKRYRVPLFFRPNRRTLASNHLAATKLAITKNQTVL